MKGHTKHTKIVATIGPSTSDKKVLSDIIRSGVDVVRLNFSHGDHETHAASIGLVRQASRVAGKTVAILMDLAGPKIRTGDQDAEMIMLRSGKTITITPGTFVGSSEHLSINYPKLHKEVERGGLICLDDGKITLRVLEVKEKDILCKVVFGGKIRSRRGVNVPGANLSIASLTEKDRVDVAFGVKHDVDYFALSFVRTAQDVRDLRALLDSHGSTAHIIAKIETVQSVENIDEIIQVSDGILVARGDLAIEIPRADVPVAQKEIVRKCNEAGKPVIVATQMLESMITSSVPTRAEVNDVANAIMDGASAVMLSGETAVGEFPKEAVSIMRDVALRMEPYAANGERPMHSPSSGKEHDTHDIVDSVSHSVVRVAEHLNAPLIVALTESGFTARMLARHRPALPILVLTPREDVVRKMALCYGTSAQQIKPFKYVGQVTTTVAKAVLKNKLAKKGDRVVLAAGVPFGRVGGTNMMLVIDV